MAPQLKDYLLDLVKNTTIMTSDKDVPLRIMGTSTSTVVKSNREDKTMIMEATFNAPIAELHGVLGLNKLSMLSGLLNFSGFRNKDAKIKIKRETKNGIETPTDIVFEAAGVASASYRLMAESVIPKQGSISNVTWTINVDQPSKMKISELAQLAGIYSSLEERFSVKVKDKELVFFIGDDGAASHKAKFIFAENVEGEVPSGFSWKIKDLISVLKLSEGTKSALRINQDGNLIQVDIDTGLCKYAFMLPAYN